MIQQILLGAPAVSSGWTTTYLKTSGGISGSAAVGYTLRNRIDSAVLIPGTKLRITFQAGTSGLGIDKAYVQINGSGTFSFSTTPIQVLFGGSASFIVGAGVDIVTDDIPLTIGVGQSVVFSVYRSSGNNYSFTNDNVIGAYTSGDYADALDPSMAGDLYEFIRKIEVYS